ncbi:MAG: TadE/TadG family type IV pilus assembly protein [Alphaproteobacteria bacterium]
MQSSMKRLANLVGSNQWRGFAAATSGLAALEFALILPLLVGLYLGGFEVSEAFMINRKVTHTTSALGDLVAQAEEISNTEVDNIFDASAAIMNPYPSNQVSMIVSGVLIDDEGTATVVWSDARNVTAHEVGTTITLPLGVIQLETFIIMAEVAYEYTPTFGHTFTGVITLSDTFYLRPRLQNVVDRI